MVIPPGGIGPTYSAADPPPAPDQEGYYMAVVITNAYNDPTSAELQPFLAPVYQYVSNTPTNQLDHLEIEKLIDQQLNSVVDGRDIWMQTSLSPQDSRLSLFVQYINAVSIGSQDSWSINQSSLTATVIDQAYIAVNSAAVNLSAGTLKTLYQDVAAAMYNNAQGSQGDVNGIIQTLLTDPKFFTNYPYLAYSDIAQMLSLTGAKTPAYLQTYINLGYWTPPANFTATALVNYSMQTMVQDWTANPSYNPSTDLANVVFANAFFTTYPDVDAASLNALMTEIGTVQKDTTAYLQEYLSIGYQALQYASADNLFCNGILSLYQESTYWQGGGNVSGIASDIFSKILPQLSIVPLMYPGLDQSAFDFVTGVAFTGQGITIDSSVETALFTARSICDTAPANSQTLQMYTDFLEQVIPNWNQINATQMKTAFQTYYANQDPWMKYPGVPNATITAYSQLASQGAYYSQPTANDSACRAAWQAAQAFASSSDDYKLLMALSTQWDSVGSGGSPTAVFQWAMNIAQSNWSGYSGVSQAGENAFFSVLPAEVFARYMLSSNILSNWVQAGNNAPAYQQAATTLRNVMDLFDASTGPLTDLQTYLNTNMNYSFVFEFSSSSGTINPTDVATLFTEMGLSSPYTYGALDTDEYQTLTALNTYSSDPNATAIFTAISDQLVNCYANPNLYAFPSSVQQLIWSAPLNAQIQQLHVQNPDAWNIIAAMFGSIPS